MKSNLQGHWTAHAARAVCTHLGLRVGPAVVVDKRRDAARFTFLPSGWTVRGWRRATRKGRAPSHVSVYVAPDTTGTGIDRVCVLAGTAEQPLLGDLSVVARYFREAVKNTMYAAQYGATVPLYDSAPTTARIKAARTPLQGALLDALRTGADPYQSVADAIFAPDGKAFRP